ncbi:glycosyltransferase family 2 protein [Azospirillum sp. TSH64]|uniref:glycosyltransferase family 2 protein n=1 Tax=Azospirillum sp. TSH64 TaxID=652740 RepID=UPI000D691319|nr:glycosyltransferase family 2 protein [Azospirillum sp. TSH64]
MIPLLSIVIPTYNRDSFLSTLLTELARQSAGLPAGTVEVVVLDNASSDRTNSVCHDIAAELPCFRYIRNPVNIGADENVLRCPEAGSGEWLWIFGDDDILHDGALARIVDLLRETSSDMVLLNYRQVHRDGLTLLAEKVCPLDDDMTLPSLGQWLEQPASLCLLAFITSAIARRAPMVKIDPSPYRTKSYFTFLGVRFEPFGDRPVHIVANPCITQRQYNYRPEHADAPTIGIDTFTGIAIYRLLLQIAKRSHLRPGELWSASVIDGIGQELPVMNFLDWLMKHSIVPSLSANFHAMTPEQWKALMDFYRNESGELPERIRNRLLTAINAAIEAHNALFRLKGA